MYKKASLFLVGILLIVLVGWQYKSQIFWNTPVVELYYKYAIPILGKEKVYDDYHIITKLDNGMPIILNKNDNCVCKSIRIVGSWEKHLTDLVLSLIKPGDTVVEVGANYGYYTLKMSKKVGNTGKIISYEANPAVYRILIESIKLNALTNVIIRPVAASSKHFNSKLAYNLSNIGGGYILNAQADHTKICINDTICESITALPLDEDLNDLSNVNIFRIDAEGSEVDILQGASKLMDRSPNMIIVMEWSPMLIKRYGNLIEFQKYLEQKGFSHIWLFNPEQKRLIASKLFSKALESFLGDIVLSRKALPSKVLEAYGSN